MECERQEQLQGRFGVPSRISLKRFHGFRADLTSVGNPELAGVISHLDRGSLSAPTSNLEVAVHSKYFRKLV